METKLRRLMVFALALGIATRASAQQWPVGEPTWYYPEPSQLIWSMGWASGWIFPLLVLCIMVALGVGIFLVAHRMHGHASQHWTPWHLGAWGSQSADSTRIRRKEDRNPVS